MRKKIEVSSDQWSDAATPPTPGGDGEAPKTGDHGESEVQIDPGTRPPDDNSISEPAAPQSNPKSELQEALRQVEELKKQLLYSSAEFQNFRRRKEEEQRDLARFANADLIKNLLPILDNFDRALQAAEQTRNFDALVTGISGTSKQFQAFLSKAGVSPIEALGKDFDPHYHEAIGHSENTEFAANTVAEEVQRGYTMHDRVLRPALVKVAQG